MFHLTNQNASQLLMTFKEDHKRSYFSSQYQLGPQLQQVNSLSLLRNLHIN